MALTITGIGLSVQRDTEEGMFPSLSSTKVFEGVFSP